MRGVQVMLDSDLARLYQCKNGTKTINLAAKRHKNRFPERFMFQLTEGEYNDLRFQIETARKRANMSRALPYVFTEQGVAMLATVIKTEVAEQVSIAIMDAFVSMRKYIGSYNYKLSNIEGKIIEHDDKIKALQESFKKFEEKKKATEVYFNGQIFVACTFHDRYFILDYGTVYHCGASVNRIGYKTFSITKIEDKTVKDLLIAKAKEIIRFK